MQGKSLVFVYGTLRKHERNDYLLIGAKCVAEQCWTNGELFDTGAGYPAIAKSAEGRVYGELYMVDDSHLKDLDHLEGYRGPGKKNLYDRIEQMVYTDSESTLAYVYVIHPDHKNMLNLHITEGDWRIYQVFKKERTFHYFAYGSCMDDERFRLSKVDHHFQKIAGCGVLDGYSLRFTRRSIDGGRADIVETGGEVEGKVYEVTTDSLDYLYRREGVGIGCYRPALIDVTVNGNKFNDVLTFVVVDKEAESAPPDHYINEIFRGGSGTVSDIYLSNLRSYLKEAFEMEMESPESPVI